jgi:acetyl esterase/lipase
MDNLIDWDAAFENGAHIPGGAAYPARWQARAAAYRDSADALLDIPYGPGPRERFDLFRPLTAPRGLVVFVHGGYWKAFDKSTWSHLAHGAVARGWAVAMPSYTLAPELGLDGMARQVAQAISLASQHVAGPVRLVGHSAGGQLVARLLCADMPDLAHQAMSISGLYDLRPLLHTRMNDILGLTDATVRSESPALQTPCPGARLTAWVGGHERPEFLRQAALMREAWPGTTLVVDGDTHHFNVIAALEQPDSALTNAALQEVA